MGVSNSMKLLKQGNSSFINSSLFCFTLLFCYFILPYLCSFLLPERFYVLSRYSEQAHLHVLSAFVISAIFFYFILKLNKWCRRVDNWPKLSQKLIYFLYLLFLVQIILIALFGTYYRILGVSDRDVLLAIQHSFLVSGTSYIFICGFLYMATFTSRKKLLMLGGLFIYIDILFMGKKFVFYLIGILLYRSDVRNKISNSKPFIYAGVAGASFLLFIFIVRSLNADSSVSIVLDVYAFFAEFIGVYATTGWAIEYSQDINGWWAVVRELSTYYIDEVGHGLALHPVAYFLAVFGELWYVYMVLYFIVLALFFYFFSMLIGSAVVLVLLVNIMHFMRHGPEIFFQQFFLQALFLSIIIYFPKLIAEERLK
jgi:hypothetical protein